jgi:hypothetical protein
MVSTRYVAALSFALVLAACSGTSRSTITLGSTGVALSPALGYRLVSESHSESDVFVISRDTEVLPPRERDQVTISVSDASKAAFGCDFEDSPDSVHRCLTDHLHPLPGLTIVREGTHDVAKHPAIFIESTQTIDDPMLRQETYVFDGGRIVAVVYDVSMGRISRQQQEATYQDVIRHLRVE